METFKHSINWFEIPVSDFDRAKLFYSMIYNYEIPEEMMGSVRMGFLLVEPGGIGGAIVQGDDYAPSDHGTRVYLNGGKDLNLILNRVEKAGGRINIKKTKITDALGYFANFIDTEGNQIAIHSMN